MSVAKRSQDHQSSLSTEKDQEMARLAQRCIMEALDRSKAASITLSSDSGTLPPIELPPGALKVIGQVLGMMSEGKPVMLMPAKQELTTVEAANYINVSRPFLIREMEAGHLPYRMVGTHRRIEFDDLEKYAETMRSQQQSALERMAQNASDLGLDY